MVEDEEGVVILEETPFYAESGGQIGDRGTISGKGFVFDVLDTQKIGDHHGHFGVVREGNLKIDTKVIAHIDESFREKIVPNHSATHLLQAALKKTLGDHIEQKGSLVGENRLRFDFSHPEQVSAEQIVDIEDLVNLQIEKNSKSVTEVMTIEEATKKGAIAFFGEKYGEEVRVVFMGKEANGFFSTELCGGTHVKNTKEVGKFKVVSQSSIASGVRRVEALRAKQLEEYEKSQKQDKSSKEKIKKDLLEKIKKELLSYKIKPEYNEKKDINMFKNKILLLTGGTGSFGNAVLQRFLDSDLSEIRVLSRDEKKQDDMRKKFKNDKLKFFLGDVRDIRSIETAFENVDYIFHAAALKQVPSCEFFPIEAVKTNVLGTENVLDCAIRNKVKKVVHQLFL